MAPGNYNAAPGGKNATENGIIGPSRDIDWWQRFRGRRDAGVHCGSLDCKADLHQLADHRAPRRAVAMVRRAVPSTGICSFATFRDRQLTARVASK
jgi:hypothetical protein